jgi:hypothetical protein
MYIVVFLWTYHSSVQRRFHLFFKHVTEAMSTQSAPVSLNTFTRSDWRVKRNIAQSCWVVLGRTYCAILIQGQKNWAITCILNVEGPLLSYIHPKISRQIFRVVLNISDVIPCVDAIYFITAKNHVENCTHPLLVLLIHFTQSEFISRSFPTSQIIQHRW